jgi:hypothetical protein
VYRLGHAAGFSSRHRHGRENIVIVASAGRVQEVVKNHIRRRGIRFVRAIHAVDLNRTLPEQRAARKNQRAR